MKTRLLLLLIFTIFALLPVAFVQAEGTARTQVEFVKGEILFPGEKVIQPVKISSLKLNFPDGTPEEISFFKRKVLTGKVYDGRTNEISSNSDTIYVIIDSYDPEKKRLRFTHISDNLNQNGKPFRINMEGEYSGLGMSSTVQSDTKTPWSGSLWIQKSKNEFKMRLIYPNGNGVDFVPVAEIPMPAPAPKKEAESGITILSNVPASEYNWIAGTWIGVIKMEKETRTLEVALIDEGIKAKYGVTGKGMSSLKLNISGGSVLFETGAKSKVNLRKVSDSRMEGTFETSNGRITEATFIKNK